MKNIFWISIILVCLSSCSTVPLTGRKQVNLLPESEMVSMALTSYSEFMSAHPLSKDAAAKAMVSRVGRNIASAVETYLKTQGLESRISHYEWEFNLVEEDVPNAWCMPGGKVVVYSGILPVCQDESGLAVVMGHEIAHAIARHGNERMSQGLLVQLGGMALSDAVKEKPEETQTLFMLAYGVAANVGVMLPYSRAHETEADRLGLIFMAMAGYNPENAVHFWQRMGSLGGTKPPEFLSTHPHDDTRVRDIQKYLPEAMKYYSQ